MSGSRPEPEVVMASSGISSWPVEAVRKVIGDQTQGSMLGFLGARHVNVLMTNLALDKTLPKAKPKT